MHITSFIKAIEHKFQVDINNFLKDHVTYNGPNKYTIYDPVKNRLVVLPYIIDRVAAIKERIELGDADDLLIIEREVIELTSYSIPEMDSYCDMRLLPRLNPDIILLFNYLQHPDMNKAYVAIRDHGRGGYYA